MSEGKRGGRGEGYRNPPVRVGESPLKAGMPSNETVERLLKRPKLGSREHKPSVASDTYSAETVLLPRAESGIGEQKTTILEMGEDGRGDEMYEPATVLIDGVEDGELMGIIDTWEGLLWQAETNPKFSGDETILRKLEDIQRSKKRYPKLNFEYFDTSKLPEQIKDALRRVFEREDVERGQHSDLMGKKPSTISKIGSKVVGFFKRFFS